MTAVLLGANVNMADASVFDSDENAGVKGPELKTGFTFTYPDGKVATVSGSNFTYNQWGWSGGTATHINISQNGNLIIDVSDPNYIVDGSIDVFDTGYMGWPIGMISEMAYWFRENDTITGSSGNEVIRGYSGDDRINGGAGNDIIDGGTGNDYAVYNSIRSSYKITANSNGYTIDGPDGTDSLTSIEYITFSDQTAAIATLLTSSGTGQYSIGDGDQNITGGQGIDTVICTASRSNFSITKTNEGYRVSDLIGSGGTDTLVNVERLQFSDANIALDTDGPTSAGGIYRLYQATFDRTPDLGGVGYWIAQADKGQSAIQMAENFTWSSEFQKLYGVTTKDNYMTGADIKALVTGFYENVLGRTPDQGGLNYYTGVINTHEKTVGQVLAEISDSPENYAATIGQIQSGIQYEPWLG